MGSVRRTSQRPALRVISPAGVQLALLSRAPATWPDARQRRSSRFAQPAAAGSLHARWLDQRRRPPHEERSAPADHAVVDARWPQGCVALPIEGINLVRRFQEQNDGLGAASLGCEMQGSPTCNPRCSDRRRPPARLARRPRPVERTKPEGCAAGGQQRIIHAIAGRADFECHKRW